MTAGSPADGSEAGRITQPLRLSDRLRPFEFSGRSYFHTSAVPLTYLAASPGLSNLLKEFAHPRRLSDVVGAGLSRPAAYFFSLLCRTGVLVDASSPDPVHALPCRTLHRQSLLLYPTTRCNLKCIYCYADSGPGAGLRMSRTRAIRAVDAFFHSLHEPVKTVQLSFHGGGEPTSNFAVMAAAWQRFRDCARQRGIAPSAYTITNGMFSARVLRALLEPEWRVAVSYDGPCQETQRPTASGRNSRTRVVANLRALLKAGKRVATRATVTRSGVGRLRDLVEDAAELGIHHVQVEGAGLGGRGAGLIDGPPDPTDFAEAFLDAFGYALRNGVRLSTSAWSHTRVGDGRFCGAQTGLRAVTPDGFLSACPEAGSGPPSDNPFLVGRCRADGSMETWPDREAHLQSRSGYALPACRECFMVDTCAGGCASRARACSGDPLARDESRCTVARIINARLMADIADGQLLPDIGWQPMEATLTEANSPRPGACGRIVALVPPHARCQWNSDAGRRPAFPLPQDAPLFFHLP